MKILVTGGSGVLGRQVVEGLRGAGHETTVFSRRSGSDGRVQGDITTGEGLGAALDGADVVVHAASASAEFTRIKQVDIEGTGRLLGAAKSAGVKHLVYISIVGVDRINYGYYRAKLAAEEAIQRGSVPWTILRATQFHELIDRVLRATARGPFLFVGADLSFQTVASGDVAARMVELATAVPAGRVDDFGGPDVLGLAEMAGTWLGRRGLHKRIVGLPLPGKAARGFRAGHHLCPEHREGIQTWDDWLTDAYAAGQVPTAYGGKKARARE